MVVKRSQIETQHFRGPLKKGISWVLGAPCGAILSMFHFGGMMFGSLVWSGNGGDAGWRFCV